MKYAKDDAALAIALWERQQEVLREFFSKRRCAYVYPDGKRCKRRDVGARAFCGHHTPAFK
jgi:hypothetical protein